MPAREFALENGLKVKIYKKRGSKHLKLSITPRGQIRVTIPNWAPYRAGYEFAKSRQDWIEDKHAPPNLLKDTQQIGKAHRIRFIKDNRAKPTVRVGNTEITIKHPENIEYSDVTVQELARSASLRALRKQAESLLPQRLASLAAKHKFEYHNVSIKLLTGRWGSCDQHKNIVLNLYLMQLPWELIDYVLLHELTHTKVLRHGPEFWLAMQNILPETKILKKRLKDHQPVLNGFD